jgi:hypothetical protein
LGIDRLPVAKSRDFVKQVITGYDHIFGPWIMAKTGGAWSPGRGSTIGLMNEDKILAATYFTDCNGASILIHAAGEGKDWLNREFLWFNFYYCFEQLGLNKIIAPIESDNTDSIRFCQHIGFTLEATLKDASPKGDILLFTMTREQCRWLSLKDKYRGQTEGASRT